MRGDEACVMGNRYRSPSGAWHLHAVEYADSASGRFCFDRALGLVALRPQAILPWRHADHGLEVVDKVRLVAVAADQGGVEQRLAGA